MSNYHVCDTLLQFVADPRIPIAFDDNSKEYNLVVSPTLSIIMVYCPFCGKKLHGIEASVSMEERLCEHLPELSGEADSSVRYRTQEQEYWLFGQAGHIVRLRYCPVCGSKLPLVKGSDRFYEKSPTEAAELANRFSSIATVEAALTQIGPPDVDRGPFQDYRYPAGIKTRVGYKRALFYSRLAKTIKVAVIEWPDGRVTVNYYPKEKAQN